MAPGPVRSRSRSASRYSHSMSSSGATSTAGRDCTTGSRCGSDSWPSNATLVAPATAATRTVLATADRTISVPSTQSRSTVSATTSTVSPEWANAKATATRTPPAQTPLLVRLSRVGAHLATDSLECGSVLHRRPRLVNPPVLRGKRRCEFVGRQCAQIGGLPRCRLRPRSRRCTGRDAQQHDCRRRPGGDNDCWVAIKPRHDGLAPAGRVDRAVV